MRELLLSGASPVAEHRLWGTWAQELSSWLWSAGSGARGLGSHPPGSGAQALGRVGSGAALLALERRLLGVWAQELPSWLWSTDSVVVHTGFVAPQPVGSSQVRDQTHVPCIGRWILNH